MAHKLHEQLSSLLRSDPVFQSLGNQTNKKKIKAIQKEAEERLRFLEKYSETKKLSILVPLVAEKASVLKGVAERCEAAYQDHSSVSAAVSAKRELLEKKTRDLANVEKLRQAMADQIIATRDRLTKLETDLNAESVKYAEGKQAELEAAFLQHKEALHDREATIRQHAILKEKKESMLQEIANQTEAMDKDYAEKQGEVANSKLKSLSGFDLCKKELGRREDYEKDAVEAEAFVRETQPDLEEVEKDVQEYEKLLGNSIKDFERPLKKVDKIKKDIAGLRKANEDVQEQLRQNNQGLVKLVEENVAIRGKMQREEKQRAILTKMIEDLEKKLGEGAGN